MTFGEYEKLAQRTSNTKLKSDKLINGAMGLCGEAGEVIELIKKWKYQGLAIYGESIIEELGDVLWYVVETASAIGISLESIASRNIEKLKKRYPDGFDSNISSQRYEK